MIMNPKIPALFFLAACPPLLLGQDVQTKDYLDSILEKPATPTSPPVGALDRTNDGGVDVRDLVIFLGGLPISATFGSAETLVFHSADSVTSVTLPIYFSKPIPNVPANQRTIKFDLGGTAVETTDYGLSYGATVPVGAKTHQLTINFTESWRGTGGEKSIRLTINRNPAAIPENGMFSTHLLRIRQFDAGEFVGLLSFPPGSGLPTLPVRIGLWSGGGAVCSFQQTGGLLGSELPLSWNAGYQGFPNFTGAVPIVIPGASLGRPDGDDGNVNASLSIQRMAAPYGGELDAYLEGFPETDQPALYHATFTFHDLIAAGARFPTGSNPYAVVHQGRLTLQPVRYAAAP